MMLTDRRACGSSSLGLRGLILGKPYISKQRIPQLREKIKSRLWSRIKPFSRPVRVNWKTIMNWIGNTKSQPTISTVQAPLLRTGNLPPRFKTNIYTVYPDFMNIPWATSRCRDSLVLIGSLPCRPPVRRRNKLALGDCPSRLTEHEQNRQQAIMNWS